MEIHATERERVILVHVHFPAGAAGLRLRIDGRDAGSAVVKPGGLRSDRLQPISFLPEDDICVSNTGRNCSPNPARSGDEPIRNLV